MGCRPECQYCNPPEVTCDKCKTVIPRAAHDNLDGGMRLSFDGWYGGTIDPFAAMSVLLCAACATALLRANPWLADISLDLTAPPEA
jgi:hypothetical protein